MKKQKSALSNNTSTSLSKKESIRSNKKNRDTSFEKPEKEEQKTDIGKPKKNENKKNKHQGAGNQNYNSRGVTGPS